MRWPSVSAWSPPLKSTTRSATVPCCTMWRWRRSSPRQGYGNNNPVDVYKRESLEMFEEMVSAIQDETVRRLYSVRLRKDEEVKRERVAKATVENVGGDGTTPKKQPVKKTIKIGRNDPCPCGSGLKWKKCTCKEYHPDL